MHDTRGQHIDGGNFKAPKSLMTLPGEARFVADKTMAFRDD